jgi:CheY-like chemotaxis protein
MARDAHKCAASNSGGGATLTKSVLIVDDNAAIRKEVRRGFERLAVFQVCGEAVDGRDAIEQARKLKPDLIILGFSMPEMNGLEVVCVLSREMGSACTQEAYWNRTPDPPVSTWSYPRLMEWTHCSARLRPCWRVFGVDESQAGKFQNVSFEREQSLGRIHNRVPLHVSVGSPRQFLQTKKHSRFGFLNQLGESPRFKFQQRLLVRSLPRGIFQIAHANLLSGPGSSERRPVSMEQSRKALFSYLFNFDHLENCRSF